MTELSTQLMKIQGGGDTPAPRFGHTLTLISKSKAVLFGGAIGDSGKFIITNETYIFDYELKKWKKLECTGDIPSQRAAHASCQIDNMTMVIYGGAASGGGGLSNDELYLLDLKQYDSNDKSTQNGHYIKVPTSGPTPGKRYGHTMVYSKPHLIVFGGNTGTIPVNDVWVLNLEKGPYQWQKQCINAAEVPAVRVYHSASLCQTGSANGMMVVFGGRTQDQSPLNDTWGLRRHRNGMWDWVLAPYKQNSAILPVCRYQHRIEFIGPLMLVIGGRTSGGEEQGKCVEVYDTESSDWYRVNSFNRYRHSTVVIDSTMYIHGGFEPEFPNKPLDSMITIDLNQISYLFPKLGKHLGVKDFNNILGERNQIDKPASSPSNQLNQQQLQAQQQNSNMFNQQTFSKKQMQNQANLLQPQNQNTNNTKAYQQTLSNQMLDISIGGIQKVQLKQLNNAQRSYTPIKQQKNNKEIRLSNQVVIARTQDSENMNQYYNMNNYQQQQNFYGGIKKVNILDLQEESKKLIPQNQNDHSMMLVSPVDQNTTSLAEMFINSLMKKPEEWKHTELRLPFKKEFILRLCDEVQQIVLDQPSLLRLRIPLKIFGNIHGRFGDLLRFFGNFGFPVDEEGGDIEKFDYLFLGNYVDRGFNSLETVILLFALKLKYPDQIHLIRGAHEERRVNRLFGFGEECAVRLNEDINDPTSAYQRINRVFDSLPLGALIEEKIFCVHGGLGPHVTHVNEIVDIKRPVSPFSNPVVYDLLYSDYVENDPLPVSENKAKDYFSTGQTFKYSEAKVERFLEETGLNMIIRSKECVFDGFSRSQSGNVTTITSCSDYMGKYGNSACCIRIKKNFAIEPNIISRPQFRNGNWVGAENPVKTNLYFTEEEQKIRRRLASPLQKQY
ncbi:serine/threonine-protein phosphatase (macronuclear) [Tetrahymena thermophila SB210]|uniref:Serine/threonine-protein phosphatase n=1 Tax=Tetrahymena thermophila (strain SB210) TaxID=312017 RepID=Q22BC4_TETTS|nr:serine/threonine-protein phosphatase [Tetrahymena thermophila SB210]EAR82584.2 serine/threonine-protein phosphatase [Tetrahymena thermophila SB210]|eukprot:XP_001030247.2 serine/threonine-protein phosphatase [Tetrahymena thermophila SB210]